MQFLLKMFSHYFVPFLSLDNFQKDAQTDHIKTKVLFQSQQQKQMEEWRNMTLEQKKILLNLTEKPKPEPITVGEWEKTTGSTYKYTYTMILPVFFNIIFQKYFVMYSSLI